MQNFCAVEQIEHILGTSGEVGQVYGLIIAKNLELAQFTPLPLGHLDPFNWYQSLMLPK